MSSFAALLEHGLAAATTDKGPWLIVAFAAGIGAWFALPSAIEWVGAGAMGCLLALAALVRWQGRADRLLLRVAAVALCLAFVAGIGVIWARSAMVGSQPLPRVTMAQLDARVLERIDQPAEQRFRLVLAARLPRTSTPIKLRVNVPQEQDAPGLAEGARIRLRARLMPPASPIFPGAYDFARKAWFDGLAATGSAIGPITVVEPSAGAKPFARLRRTLAEHVRQQLGGPPGAIAAAFASGDRGALSSTDEDAMRDAGLTHLLSISGLHVSAVIAAAYVCAFRLLALWPWLAVRVRLPLLAAAAGACAGVGYTLLTGAQVPTVRSCIGAGLVLVALALGREPLSMRMVAIAAGVVLLLWPESLVGPSFQMSFAAVIAIIALHGAEPVRRFLAPREEGWPRWAARRIVMLFVTGLVIELVLMPVVLYHFHRSGLYGAAANVVAIPLVTFVAMPLIGFALVLDLVGLGAPVWWLVGEALQLLLTIAHVTAAQPGSVKLVPQIDLSTLLLFVGGGLWLALWRGPHRLWGLAPMLLAAILIALAPTPDVLIGRAGRQVGIVTGDRQLLVLREGRGGYGSDSLKEMAAVASDPIALIRWPGARCNHDACILEIERGGRRWSMLLTRSAELIAWRDLVRSCAQVDIVVSDRWLPRACRPRWLKADRAYLARNGGLALDLRDARIETVAAGQGAHGWWRGRN